jgi:predicted RNase H-like HicB family nuclease
LSGGSSRTFGVTEHVAVYWVFVANTGRNAVRLTAIFQKVPEGYIGFVEEVPGANTQGETLDETRENLAEALELVLEANRLLAEEAIKDQEVIREPLVVAAG